jgi:hypothetical protein
MNQEPNRRREPDQECPQTPAKNEAEAISATLVIQRLRLEAMLAGQGLVMRVGGNMILLPYPGFAAVVTIDQQQDAGFAVQIHSCLGEVLLADEAQLILESDSVNAGNQQVVVTEPGLVAVRWEAAFAGPIDVVAVIEALRENLRVAFRVQQALAEDCYLKPAELPETLLQKGRP